MAQDLAGSDTSSKLSDPPVSSRPHPGQGGRGEPPHRSSQPQRPRDSGDREYSHHPPLPKMTFPKFTGEHPKIWIDKCEDYFNIFNIQEKMWVTAAALHMEGNAAQWFQVYKARQGVGMWAKFVEAVQAKFGVYDYQNAVTELLDLKQTGTVEEYVAAFEELQFQVAVHNVGIDEVCFVSQFMRGLKPELRYGVHSEMPETVEKAIMLAKIQQKLLEEPKAKMARGATTLKSNNFPLKQEQKHWTLHYTDGPRAPARQASLSAYGRRSGRDVAAAGECGNVAFSPLSVYAALALVAVGARGATLAQLLAFLGAPSADGLADFSRRVAHRVLADRSDAGGPRVLFGGGVDPSRGGLADAFRDVAARFYKSEARTVSFAEEAELQEMVTAGIQALSQMAASLQSQQCDERPLRLTYHQDGGQNFAEVVSPEAAVKTINEWMKKATDNLIDSIVSVDDINPTTNLVLANAVYFKGAWLDPFRSGTIRGEFHCLDSSLTNAVFMAGFRYMDVACMDGFLSSPTSLAPHVSCREGDAAKSQDTPSPEVDEGNQYSMFIFLPDVRNGLSTMVDVVTASPAFLYGIIAKPKMELVKFKMPKFEISFSWSDLKRDLRRLELSLPFSQEAADLRGMCMEDDNGSGGARRATFLDTRAVIKVNEAGTEATAVTFSVRGGGGGPPPVEFTANHPFTFFIVEELSGVIVFARHVLDPTKPGRGRGAAPRPSR
ncbi:LOW QUALITY PROTEIN: hypothetical protein U9M48_002138 [Paspalum notatum var. saurae]|uniref:Serpin domain-containing protein n=1 Tax=Paspalum notatum var. saurae TaxID=547442 RepID=A0AAQ3SDB4_PASNO